MTDSSPNDLRYRVPNGRAQSEVVIKNSVFIGNVGRAPSVEAAEQFVEEIANLYDDASHNAWAFRITGGPQALIGSSDDGEPGGTAGGPMLAVLEGRELYEVAAVGTRYFGGTKLGTGGLVRAYGNCVREALKALPMAEMVYHRRAEIAIDYSLYGNLVYLLPRHGVRIEDETFTDQATLTLGIPNDQVDSVGNMIRELTNGQIDLSKCRKEGYYVEFPV